MRPKVVFFLLFIVVATLAAAIFLKRPKTVAVPETSAVVVTDPVPAKPAPVVVNTPRPVQPVLTPEARQAAIQKETERLAVWAMNNDRQSLSNILGDLTSSEKEIRMAAIEAVKQFDSPDAIPVLKGMAANTEDIEEASALLEAAEFLSLPDANLVNPNPNPIFPPPPSPSPETNENAMPPQ